MRFLQQFHLVIKYKKGNTKRLEDIISIPPTSNIVALINLIHMNHIIDNAYKQYYIED
jgi:hypothetical protein